MLNIPAMEQADDLAASVRYSGVVINNDVDGKVAEQDRGALSLSGETGPAGPRTSSGRAHADDDLIIDALRHLWSKAASGDRRARKCQGRFWSKQTSARSCPAPEIVLWKTMRINNMTWSKDVWGDCDMIGSSRRATRATCRCTASAPSIPTVAFDANTAEGGRLPRTVTGPGRSSPCSRRP